MLLYHEGILITTSKTILTRAVDEIGESIDPHLSDICVGWKDMNDDPISAIEINPIKYLELNISWENVENIAEGAPAAHVADEGIVGSTVFPVIKLKHWIISWDIVGILNIVQNAVPGFDDVSCEERTNSIHIS